MCARTLRRVSYIKRLTDLRDSGEQSGWIVGQERGFSDLQYVCVSVCLDMSFFCFFLNSPDQYMHSGLNFSTFPGFHVFLCFYFCESS